nr:MAG: hypothetical protein DIU61_19980 [Bacteroidota bacterium]
MEALLCGARLILGPLNYDEDIFASAIRMQTWDPAELASLIVQALNDQRKTELSPKEIAAMSRETNMEAMHQLYRSVTGVGGIAQESRN